MLALVTGVFLGVVFFGGLWWTVRKGFSSEQPGQLFFVSLLLRTGLVLAGFYLIGRDHWERLLVCLLGFVIARFFVTWRTRPAAKPAYLAREASHASYPR
jgi:F1F0 ATPase subunit 2